MYGILCQNVGKYSSPMEHMGYIDIYIYIDGDFSWFFWCSATKKDRGWASWKVLKFVNSCQKMTPLTFVSWTIWWDYFWSFFQPPNKQTQTIHGTNGIFTDPWMVDFYGINVGKYAMTMDPMGLFQYFPM